MILVSVGAGITSALAMEERDETLAPNTTQAVSQARDRSLSRMLQGVTPTPSPPPTPIPAQLPEIPSPEPVLDVGEPPVSPDSGQPIDVSPVPSGGTLIVSLTFYNCRGQGGGYCGAMSSGVGVYEGAAACGYGLPLGTRFSIVGEGRVYVCEDRGLGPYDWIDIFFWDYDSGRAWRNNFGQSVEIVIQ